MFRRSIALGVALLGIAVLAGPAAASHSWGNYHWARTANPFTLKVGDNVSATWDAHLVQAIADWSGSTVLDLVEEPGQAKGKCRPTSGRIEVCSGSYGFNGWLGLAQIWISGSHITQATTKVNDSYFNTSTYNDPTKRQHVICQEIGHDFGLDHQDESGADLDTCMDYSNALDNPIPNAHDYEQLETIYGSHLDSSSTVASFPEHAAVVAVERWDTIRTSKVIEHFEGGFARITFIHWALDGPGRS